VSDGLKKNTVLTKDQKDFIDFTVAHNGYSVAAHGTGTGKTLAAIAAAMRLKKLGKINKTLVLVPASLGSNFIDNVRKFTNTSAGYLGDKNNSKNFIVTSYDKFRKDPIGSLQRSGADSVIADELHRVKDKQTLTNSAIRKIRPKIRSFIGLTATPAQNDIYEAINVYNAVSPNPISISDFKNRYEKRKATGIRDALRSILLGKAGRGPLTGFHRQHELSSKMKSLYHIVPESTGNKPTTVEKFVWVKMSPVQRSAYRAALKKELTKNEILALKNKKLDIDTASRIVNRAMAARQVSNDPGYLFKKNEPLLSTKTTKATYDIIEHLKKDPRNKAVLFSNFKRYGTNSVSKLLSKLHVPFSKFEGGMTKKLRDKSVREYNGGLSRIMLITGAGAEGLDLPNTTMISLLDGHYNPKKISQVIGRGVRYGGLRNFPKGQRSVVVTKYIADPETSEGSVDWHVYRVAKNKAENIDKFWSAVEKPRFSLSPRQKALLVTGGITAGALSVPGIVKQRGKIVKGISSVVGKTGNLLKGIANKFRFLKKASDDTGSKDFRNLGVSGINIDSGSIVPAVIQKHDASHLHYDIRLWSKNDNAGHSWATNIKTWPVKKGMSTLVIRQPSHPLDYFKFSGTIPEGYGAGTVRPAFLGMAKIEKANDNKVVFSLTGKNSLKFGKRFLLLKEDDKKWRLTNITN